MTHVVADRVKETTTTTGTGTITLGGAQTGFQSFAAIGNGNSTYYCISSSTGSEWEVGLGTYSSGSLTRDTIIASSNGGSLVSFSAGTKDVACTYPAKRAVVGDQGIIFSEITISRNVAIPDGYNGFSPTGTNGASIASGVSVTIPSGSVWVIV